MAEEREPKVDLVILLIDCC